MTERYEVNGETVLDTATGLEWQAKTSDHRMTWYEANEYVEGLGEGWRLPTVEELSTLVDYDRIGPATTFPGHEGSAFWSSSVVADFTSDAWYVLFDDGCVNGVNKNIDARVRCVRRGPRDRRFGSLAEAEARIRKLEAELDRQEEKTSD